MTTILKIPPPFAALFMGLLVALSTGLIMSFVVTVINLGLRGDSTMRLLHTLEACRLVCRQRFS